jgi:hypothetical protein
MKMKHIMLVALVIVVIAGGAFYGGVQYEKGIAAKVVSPAVRNFVPGNRQSDGANQTGGRGMGQNSGMRRGGPNGGSFLSGEILSKDEKSLTIKTSDGGSTIVYFTDALGVRKTEMGSLTDLATGQQVMVNGKSNPDGSLSAETVSLVPATK